MTKRKVKRLRDLLKYPDQLRYLLWRISKTKHAIAVRLKSGTSLTIRPEPTTDLATAYEIFIAQAYRKPELVPDLSPNLIVDVGGNVGFSIIYWAAMYPHAQLITFEPLAAHVLMINKNIVHNQITDRIKIIGNAVSNKKYQAFMVERENESILVDYAKETNCHQVNVLDLFEEIGDQKIDLLKMDIEGGEYSILEDDRFGKLNVKQVVLEWHNTDEISNGYQWCKNRFSDLGFETIDGELRYPQAGILWAWKPV